MSPEPQKALEAGELSGLSSWRIGGNGFQGTV